jgi:branched-chain amino acid transport system permease protein
VLGAAIITGLPEWLRRFQEYSDFVYGGLLLAFLVFMPRGIAGALADLRRGWHRSRAGVAAIGSPSQ